MTMAKLYRKGHTLLYDTLLIRYSFCYYMTLAYMYTTCTLRVSLDTILPLTYQCRGTAYCATYNSLISQAHATLPIGSI